MQTKPFWKSKTFWGILLLFLTALQPTVQKMAEQDRPPTAAEWSQLFFAAVSAGAGIYGRYSATLPIHTPKGMPGRDSVDSAKQAWRGDNES